MENRFSTSCPRALNLLLVTGRALGIWNAAPHEAGSRAHKAASKGSAATVPLHIWEKMKLTMSNRGARAGSYAEDPSTVDESACEEMAKFIASKLRCWAPGNPDMRTPQTCAQELKIPSGLVPRGCVCLKAVKD